MRFSDRFLYYLLLAFAIIFTLSGLFILGWNLERLDSAYTNMILTCAPNQDYLCLLNEISDYNISYATYYHILAGLLCLSAIFASAIVTFIFQNSRFMKRRRDD